MTEHDRMHGPRSHAHGRPLAARVRRSLLAAAVLVVMSGVGLVTSGAAHASSSTCASGVTATASRPALPQALADAGYSLSDWVYAGVAGLGNGSAVAVGSYSATRTYVDPSTGETRTEGREYPNTERWAGSGWTQDAIDTPAGGSLAAVGGTAADAWAVGVRFGANSTEPYQVPLLEHWNGSAWSAASAAGVVEGGSLSGVAAVASNDAWAVGSTEGASKVLVLHWDGIAWTRQPGADTLLGPLDAGSIYSIAAVRVGDHDEVFAAGGRYDPAVQRVRPLVIHSDGTSWSVMATPDAPPGVTTNDSVLRMIAAPKAGDIYALGWMHTSGFSNAPLLLHYDGARWSASAMSSDAYGAALAARTSASGDEVWLGGEGAWSRSNPGSGWLARGNGAQFRESTGPGWVSAIGLSGPGSGWLAADPNGSPYKQTLFQVTTCGN